jgi:hypothetical protein
LAGVLATGSVDWSFFSVSWTMIVPSSMVEYCLVPNGRGLWAMYGSQRCIGLSIWNIRFLAVLFEPAWIPDA